MLLMLFLFVVYLISAFQAAHYHLEETVQQRTAALQAEIQERKRLEVAKIQAERLAMVGTMAAQVAHEVRNPLGSITLNLDLIQKEIDKLAEGGGHSPEEGRVLVDGNARGSPAHPARDGGLSAICPAAQAATAAGGVE